MLPSHGEHVIGDVEALIERALDQEYPRTPAAIVDLAPLLVRFEEAVRRD